MNENVRHANVWLWLTFPIAILLTIAAGGGVFISGLYRDTPYFAAQAVGQDIVSLAVVLPTLIVTAFLAGRGSPRARLIWLGGLVYLVYTYVVAAFDVSFNSLFLVYVALLGCSLYALIGGLVTADMAGIKACFTEKTPVKTVSIYLAVLAVLFYFIWLSEIVPALMAGEIPQSIRDNGTPTNAVHVLDMAWVLPSFGITVVSLWRKQALGYTLAGAVLSYGVFLTLAILSMVMFMIREGHPVVVPQVVIFGVLFAISLGMLIWYMRGLKSSPVPK
ncbi:MAG: hypothetical protein GXO75_21640 [Calditrichaeota bacterium]|nr:hypothetical protein [Calditrichota bacterium]